EDGRKGEEAWDFAYALGEAGVGPVEARPLDRKVVEQRRPAGIAQIIDKAQRHHESDGRGAELGDDGNRCRHGRNSFLDTSRAPVPARIGSVNASERAAGLSLRNWLSLALEVSPGHSVKSDEGRTVPGRCDEGLAVLSALARQQAADRGWHGRHASRS